MRTLSKTDKTTLVRTINVDTKSVGVVHTVKPTIDSPVRYEMTWTLDFRTCSDKQMLELASRSALIDAQRKWRGETDAQRLDGERWDGITINVADAMGETRRTADPVSKAANAVNKLTPEQRAAFIAELTKDTNVSNND